MVLSIVVFCIVSIIVYFAVPELGHFVYWDNNERYLSARLAGIAGSANNLGRLAAFGLILVGLYAREFRRYHRHFVPVSAFIMGLALLMTNSRTSMAMVVAILFSIYALNWRRLYLVVLLASLGLFRAGHHSAGRAGIHGHFAQRQYRGSVLDDGPHQYLARGAPAFRRASLGGLWLCQFNLRAAGA
jgi:hypothetical protein